MCTLSSLIKCYAHAEHTHKFLMPMLSALRGRIKYFNPQFAHPRRLYGVKITTIRTIENLTLGHL
jgi:hypothetical protein